MGTHSPTESEKMDSEAPSKSSKSFPQFIKRRNAFVTEFAVEKRKTERRTRITSYNDEQFYLLGRKLEEVVDNTYQLLPLVTPNRSLIAKQLIDKLEMQLELNESPSVVSLCNIFLQKLKTFKLDRFKIIVDGHRFELDGQGLRMGSRALLLKETDHLMTIEKYLKIRKRNFVFIFNIYFIYKD